MWTRNYNNLVNTLLTRNNMGKESGTSIHPFDDTYTGNYKNTLGSVYEICNYNTGYPMYVARAALVHNPANDAAPTASVGLLKNTQTHLNGTSGYHTGGIYVAFGDDDTGETYEDYRIDDVITAFIENTKTATVTENADGTLKIDYHIMITATDTITIREVGIFVPIPRFSTGNNNVQYGYYALINRIVLEEEISAVKDDVVHIDFSITTPKISING